MFSDPWSLGDFTECARSPVAFLVAEERGVVMGYIIARHVADEGEILNLGVAPAHRRSGIGRALVERALTLLGREGVRKVYLEVRESNTAARRLYDRLGFAEVARRTRYYRRPIEDAVVLAAALPSGEVVAKL